MDIIFYIIVGFGILLFVANWAKSACDEYQYREYNKQLAKARDEERRLEEMAKINNVYYNRYWKCFEEDFNYDGTPKRPDARPLSKR